MFNYSLIEVLITRTSRLLASLPSTWFSLVILANVVIIDVLFFKFMNKASAFLHPHELLMDLNEKKFLTFLSYQNFTHEYTCARNDISVKLWLHLISWLTQFYTPPENPCLEIQSNLSRCYVKCAIIVYLVNNVVYFH